MSSSSPPAGRETTVEMLGVTHRYANGETVTTVLDEVTISIGSGEVVALAGRSGSGKSTLCSLIAGLSSPTMGTVMAVGRPAHEVKDWELVALLPQSIAVAEELTVAENVGLPRLLRGRQPDPGLLARLDLAGVANRPAAQTSLGEQQRAALGRALALKPAVALLDEPTSHQDDEHVEVVLAIMRSVAAGGTSVLVATHDERVLAVADRVVRLEAGRVLAEPPSG
jgi:ABC-type lipoprotein export system ATPase subunit